MDIRKILQDAEVGPVDAVLFVLLFLAFGYISYLIFLEFSDRLKPKAAAPSSKVGSSKRAPRSREQLLKPIEKKIGVKEMSLEELADASKEGAGLLLGCKGRVFDVSSNEMYAPDGAYHLKNIAPSRVKNPARNKSPAKRRKESDTKNPIINRTRLRRDRVL